MHPKTKILSLIALQIIIIVASFFILILIENESSVFRESINHAGKNRYFSAILMHELMEYHLTSDPSMLIFNLNEFTNNLEELELILQNEFLFLSIHDDIKTEFLHILDDYLIVKSGILLDIENGDISDSREKLFDAQLTDLITDTDDLTIHLSDHVTLLSNQMMLLELFLAFTNIIAHVILIFVIIRIQRNDAQKRQQLEGELHTKEKMSSIGQITSRLAHDLRNPLSVIQMSLNNLKMMYEIDDKKQKQMDKIDRSIDRMTHQINDVLDYVKENPLVCENTKISEIISESLDSIKIPEKIRFSLPKNDVIINCDKRQVVVVLNNLILNGIQAMNDEGLITINIDEKDDRIILKVKDSGKGIPEKDLPHLFDPLFTTKQEGTGLGLVSVKSIIEAHGGTISVTSSPTIFTITLPKI